MRTVTFDDDGLRLIDQRLLPERLAFLTLRTPAEVAEAIRDMAVRGAPAIGAAAAYGLALAATPGADAGRLRADLTAAATLLAGARPTAANLRWALDRVLARADACLASGGSAADLRAAVVDEAHRIADEDVAANRRMGALGAALLPDGATVLHHCNTGALATVDYGTALGVVRAAWEAGQGIHVLVGETRPRLQGARLTAWELEGLGVPYTLIADSAAGHYMAQGEIDAVLVGADRIAANGDTANKVGTYPLAVLAAENGVPFYVVAPTSTVDVALPTGAGIPIESRPAEEVTVIDGRRIAPVGAQAANPAFDLTPHRFLTAIVTEAGVVRPPFELGLAGALRDAATHLGAPA